MSSLCPTPGLITRQEGDIQGSLELFQKAVRLNPNNPANIKQVARSLWVHRTYSFGGYGLWYYFNMYTYLFT